MHNTKEEQRRRHSTAPASAMAFTALLPLVALAIALVSLICSVYFQHHAGNTANRPIYIAWITLSAAIAYVLLCFIIVRHFRGQQHQHSAKSVKSRGYRISRRSNDTDTDTPDEEAAPNQHASLSTFYYCDSSFAAIHLNSAMGTPRTPQTVIRHPPRSSSLLPPSTTHYSLSPRLSTKLQTASKLNLFSVQAVKVDVVSGSKKGKKEDVDEKETVRRESLEKLMRAMERRSRGVRDVKA